MKKKPTKPQNPKDLYTREQYREWGRKGGINKRIKKIK